MKKTKDIEDTVIREFLKNERMIREFIRCLVHHWQDAEDIFQETSVLIIRKSSELDDMTRFPQWCRSVARNNVRNYWRKKGRGKEELWDDFSQVVDDCYSSIDIKSDVFNERRRLMDLCVGQLPDVSRGLLKDFYLKRIGAAKLALRMKRSSGSIRVALLRIRAVVRKCVEVRASGLEVHHAK